MMTNDSYETESSWIKIGLLSLAIVSLIGLSACLWGFLMCALFGIGLADSVIPTAFGFLFCSLISPQVGRNYLRSIAAAAASEPHAKRPLKLLLLASVEVVLCLGFLLIPIFEEYSRVRATGFTIMLFVVLGFVYTKGVMFGIIRHDS